MAIQLGRMYKECITTLKSNNLNTRLYDNLTSSLFQEAIQPLQVTLYFEDILNDVYDSQEC